LANIFSAFGRLGESLTEEFTMNAALRMILMIGVLISGSQAMADCPTPFPENPTPQDIRLCLAEVGQLRKELSDLRSSGLAAIPSGAVLAFDAPNLNQDRCPLGWTPFLEARGRTIVGAGDPSRAPGKMAADENGRMLKGYVLRQHGGEQMLARLEEDPVVRGVVPHSNIIPYVALYYCRKD
jgi:hypothetical protein